MNDINVTVKITRRVNVASTLSAEVTEEFFRCNGQPIIENEWLYVHSERGLVVTVFPAYDVSRYSWEYLTEGE